MNNDNIFGEEVEGAEFFKGKTIENVLGDEVSIVIVFDDASHISFDLPEDDAFSEEEIKDFKNLIGGQLLNIVQKTDVVEIVTDQGFLSIPMIIATSDLELTDEDEDDTVSTGE